MPLVFTFDPTLVRIGPWSLSWYGLLFVLAAVQGVLIFRGQLAAAQGTAGPRPPPASPMLWMGLFGIIVGGRLAHLCFYAPAQLGRDPIGVLTSWRGGFASHGSALGLMVALWVYARRFGLPYLRLCDRFALAVPLGTSLVRLGNFLNSEIVGRPTALPWGIVFARYDAALGLPPTPRHPSQLYEAAVGLGVFVLLLALKRREERSPSPGLMTGVFLTAYFATRILVEAVKEHQILAEAAPVTMGQILSVPFVLVGMVLIARSRRSRV